MYKSLHTLYLLPLIILAISTISVLHVESMLVRTLATQEGYAITVDGDPSDWPSIPAQHPQVSIDGNTSDWYSANELSENNYTVVNGEYIWRDRVGDERTNFEIVIDGNSNDWVSWRGYFVAEDAIDPDPTALDISGANLTRLYVAWDQAYLYIAFETNSSKSWDVDYGIAIDTGDGGYTSSTTGDAYGKNISFNNYAPDFEIYIQVRGNIINKVTLHNWTGTSWQWIVDLTDYRAYFEAGVFKFIELRIRWGTMGINKPDNIAVNVWAAGVSVGDSAVDSIPHDSTVMDDLSNEWSDNDTFTQLASISLDEDNEVRDRRVDITEFHVTSNQTHLLLLIRLREIFILGEDGAPAILVAMDTDTIYTNGERWLALNCDTQTSSNGPWDYHLVIDLARPGVNDLTLYRGGDGTNSIIVYDPSWSDVVSSNTSFIVNSTAKAIEVAIYWSDIGVSNPRNVSNVRFTVATVRSNGAGDAWDIAGVSDVLDCITSYGVNTWDEVKDDNDPLTDQPYGVIDGDGNETKDSGDGRAVNGFMDVGFNTIPEPASLQPLFLYNSTYLVVLDPFNDHREDYLKGGPGSVVEDWDVDVIEFRMYINRSDDRVYFLVFMHGNVNPLDAASPAIAVVIDYTPLDPGDGVSEWVYAPSGWGYTDTFLRLDPSTNSTWQYIVWFTTNTSGNWLVILSPTNTAGDFNPVDTEMATNDHVIEASIPADYIGGLTMLSKPFRINILVYGYNLTTRQLINLTSSNVYDIGGVSGTWDTEVSDTDWGIDTVFIRKLSTRLVNLDTYHHRLVYYPRDVIRINATLQYYNLSTDTWEGLPNQNVKIYLIGSTVYLGSNTTDENGTIYLETLIPATIEEGNYTLYGVFNETLLYLEATNTGPQIQIKQPPAPIPETIYTPVILATTILAITLVIKRRK